MNANLSRRSVLRGTIGGAAVAVGLPLLNCHLNGNGTALAATGGPLPVRFGFWYQGLGLNPGMWVPEKVGAGYNHNTQLKLLEPFRDRTNIFSGLRFFLDGRPHETHTSSVEIGTTGIYGATGPSFDSNIADAIGTRTRFRSLEIGFAGRGKSLSRRSATQINPSEASPVALYQRIFGSEFHDPNAADFKPDPMLMARQSVLTGVTDRRKNLERQLGASDKVRLDEYFTGLREIEQKLALGLEKPAPMPACAVPTAGDEAKPGSVVEDITKNSKLFGALMAHAIACDQTRVFNIDVGSGGIRHAGSTSTWHTSTHEESVDEKLGYQREVYGFIAWANQMFVDFLHTMQNMKEGDGTLLDRSLVLWQTDHGDARTHSLENVPLMTVGSAGGKFKTGLHINLPGDPYTRVGLTVQQALGVPMNSWGDRSNKTTKTVTEILA